MIAALIGGVDREMGFRVSRPELPLRVSGVIGGMVSR
jgi:hypothetical protein